MNRAEFQEVVWDYFYRHERPLPWRDPEPDGSYDAYKILLSEVMLQQTQAARVIPKYLEFLKRFPTVNTLAAAPLADVLVAWSGLGYNRRAKYLHEAARQLAGARQPWSATDLVTCKGIGANTAAAVCVYAYNQPLAFIETNIRTVFIHHFFADHAGVADKDISPIVEQALDHEHPREWYWALMDYGVHIKTTIGNASRSSKHYAKQSVFQGSKRQVRGQVLRVLGESARTPNDLQHLVADDRLQAVLIDLERDGLITRQSGLILLG
jgi:A/G-specific adenine glycosylase